MYCVRINIPLYNAIGVPGLKKPAGFTVPYPQTSLTDYGSTDTQTESA